jgi:S-adenosylmethionine:tRNA ribosyltransferase-isomerase
MKLSYFDYHLPKELIAQRPASPRTHSRLMVLKNDQIEHKKFYEIIDYFKKGDVLVLNETKVLKIKLIGKKETGGKIELMLEGNEGTAIIKGRAKVGNKIIFDKKIIGIIEEKEENKIKIKFNIPIEEVIKKIGKLPTPPYIKKELKSDSEYQTVFAKKAGSFACPTSGLHFDEELLKKLKEKGVTFAKVCLHVSFDTFLPVECEDLTKHQMHGEYCEVDSRNVRIINSAKRLFVLGTTALRTLESLSKPDGKIYAGNKITKLFIYPGYKFNLKYSGLITNFHLPKSTLLMMISAFYGKEKVFEAYEIAVKEKYRFFSLGDAMLILK